METAATAVVEESPRRGRINTFRALGYRDYRFLWLGQIANSAALWTEQVARPLLILDLVPDPAQAALHLGLILGARTLPQLGFGLLGGVFADWYDRRTLLLLAKTPYMLVNFIFAVIILSGQVELWHVYVTTILKGILTSFDNPARQALIPSLVGPDDLVNAVALNSASMQTMRIGGGMFAGILIVLAGIGGAFLAVAFFSAGAVLFTVLMRVPPMPAVAEKGVTGALTSFREGARYGWGDLTIRGILLLMLVYFVLGMAYLQVFAPLFAKQVMNIGDVGFGLMISTAGVGSLVGALAIATFSPTRRRGPVLLIFMGLLGVLLTGFALSTYTPWPLMTFGFVALVGMLQSTSFALANSVILQTTRMEMRGRIMGLLSLDRASITLGGTLAGLVSAIIGPQLGQLLFGAGCIACAVLLAILLPSVRRIQ